MYGTFKGDMLVIHFRPRNVITLKLKNKYYIINNKFVPSICDRLTWIIIYNTLTQRKVIGMDTPATSAIRISSNKRLNACVNMPIFNTTACFFLQSTPK